MSTPNETPSREWIRRMADAEDKCESVSAGGPPTPTETRPPEGYEVQQRPICLFTRNPCGTDTWQVGRACRCDNCQAWAQGWNQGKAAAEAQCEQLRGEVDECQRARMEFLHKLESVRAPLEGYIATLKTERDALRAENAKLRGLLNEFTTTHCHPFCMYDDPEAPNEMNADCDCEACEFFGRLFRALGNAQEARDENQ